jgi:hypothetical protein
VIWWDATHRKFVAGPDDFNTGNLGGYIIRFSRDNNGKLDLENRSYDESEASRLKKVKDDKEMSKGLLQTR